MSTPLFSIVLALICCLVVSCLIEVVFGSHGGLYDAELGFTADAAKRARLLNREFFSRHIPMMLGGAGLLSLLVIQLENFSC